jgi:DNA-binding transcriptional LysR family regulator
MLKPAQLLRIDLSLLVLFSTVLEEGHVARAAQRLNLTPSAVSHGLRRLRRLLGDPLFLKIPGGVKPTDRARELAAPVADVLMRVEGIVSAAAPFDPKKVQRSFTIGAPDALAAIFLGPFVARLAREAPGIDIRLLQLMPQHHGKPTSQVWQTTLSELDAQRLDLAVLPIGPLPPRFAERLLFEEDFVVAMRKGSSPSTQAQPRMLSGRTAHARFGHRRCAGGRGRQIGRERTFPACHADGAEFHDGAGTTGRKRFDSDVAAASGETPCSAFQAGDAPCAASLDTRPGAPRRFAGRDGRCWHRLVVRDDGALHRLWHAVAIGRPTNSQIELNGAGRSPGSQMQEHLRDARPS